jgi:hypothetical protein
MSIYLCANIGTRDVQLTSLDGLPTELIANPHTGQLKARPAGEYMLHNERLPHFLRAIRLPMIDKALNLIKPSQWADLRIVLFATDQDQTVKAAYRDGDTIHFAHLIREVLFHRHQRDGLAKKQIEVRRCNLNPADYDRMYEFYRQELAVIARRDPAPNPAYLLIAGGTPQMNTMLLLLGTEAFGPVAVPLYVAQDGDRARKLNTVRLLYQQAFQRNLSVMLKAYAYGPVLQVLRENVDYLDSDQVRLLEAILRYALARRNLDLTAAVESLDDAIMHARDLRELIASLQQDVTDQSEASLLRETIFLAQIAERTESWPDFLARLHRFSEGCLQLLAERLGVQWSDPTKRSSYAPTWWNAQRSMLAALGLADSTAPDDPQHEKNRRQVDRKNLRQIVTALTTAPEHTNIQTALEALTLVDAPIPLRNDIVHRFKPLSREEIETKAGASIDALLTALRQTYALIFGRIVPEESPYDTINKLCADILKGQK